MNDQLKFQHLYFRVVDGRDRPLQIQKSIEFIAHIFTWSFVLLYSVQSGFGIGVKRFHRLERYNRY